MYVNQRPAADDEVGQIISAMSVRVDLRRGAARPRGVAIDEVLSWAGEAGLVGEASTFEGQFRSSPADRAEGHRTSLLAGSSRARRSGHRGGDEPGCRGVVGPARR